MGFVPILAQDRGLELIGGVLTAATIISGAESPETVSSLQFCLSVSGGIVGVFLTGKFLCNVDGSLKHCIINGSLGGVVGGLYLAYLHRNKNIDSPGQPIFEIDVSSIENLLKYSVIIVPSVLGAIIGFNQFEKINDALFNLQATNTALGVPGVSKSLEFDYFNRPISISKMKIIQISL